MNRQSLTFIAAFAISAAAVAALVYAGRPLWALAAGVAGLLLHWAFSRHGDRDGEVADSSYFLGFLLTLVILAVGIYRIGSPAAAAGRAGGTEHILGFLVDLAAGLALTIVGLLIRQARTLATQRGETQEERSLLDAQRALTENLRHITELWSARPEQQVIEQLNESRTIARDAAEQLDRTMSAAGNRMAASMERLEDATADATRAMTRSASAVSDALSGMAQRLEVEIGEVMKSVHSSVSHSVTSMQAAVAAAVAALEQQRVAAAEALAAARAAGEQLVNGVQTHQQQQIELWQATVDQGRSALEQANRSLADEYRRGLEGFAATGEAFAKLTETTASYVEALPNPAARLAGLWDGVRQLESELTSAITGSVEGLLALRARTAELEESLERLGGSADRAASQLGGGSERLSASLQNELSQMNGVIDDYVRVLERTVQQLKVRA